MSDEPSENAAPQPSTLVTVTCPFCKAGLRQARIEPGGRIRCVNCGKRFAAQEPPVVAPAPVPLNANAGGDARATMNGSGQDARTPKHGQDVHATEHERDARATKRPPRSPGYWMVRVLAVLVWGIACIGAGLAAHEIIVSSWRRGLISDDDRLALAYLALAPLGGAFLVLLTRALAVCDAGVVGRGWRCGVLREPLPPPLGSSLPYIGPLAVAGGLLPVMWYCAFPDHMEFALAGVLLGAGVLYLGVSLEDLRQFLWRQRLLARACCQSVAEQPTSVALGATPRCGLLLGSAVVIAGVAVTAIGLSSLQWRSWQQEDCIWVFLGAAILAAAYSLRLLGGDWDEAVAWWELAAQIAEEPRAPALAAGGVPRHEVACNTAAATGSQQQPEAARGTPAGGSVWLRWALLATAVVAWLVLWFEMNSYEHYSDGVVQVSRIAMWATGALLSVILSGWYVAWARRIPPATMSLGMRRFCQLPLVWAAGETVWFVAMYVEHGSPGGFWRMGPFVLWLSVVVFAAWLAAFLALARRWRGAQQRFWAVRDPEVVKTLPLPPPAWQSWLVWGTVALALGQAVLFGLWFWNLWVWRSSGRALEFAGALPLLLVAFHYPTIWLALLLREWFGTQRVYEIKTADEDA